MKKLLVIVGIITTLLVVGLTLIAWVMFDKVEFDKNKTQTQKARDARWSKKVDDSIIEDAEIVENGQQHSETKTETS